MTPSRTLFLATFLLCFAVAASFHASGVVSASDAWVAAAGDGSLTTRPPHPVTTRLLHTGADLVRLVWAPTGLFRTIHLAAGLLLALAAATSAIVAARIAAGRSGTGGLAAAILVGASIPFGADTGGLGLAANPVPVLLALLAGAAWAWTAPRPRPFLAGLLLGLATADHPLVVFLLPGFGAFALQASVRTGPGPDRGLVRRSALGFALGGAAVFLPLWDATGPGLVHILRPHDPLAAFAAWSRAADGPFWSFGDPRRWLAGLVEWGIALWRNVGPVGLFAGIAGFGAFFGGEARFARPFLLIHAILAAALVLGNPADHGTAAALAGWSFLFWAAPALGRLEARLAGGAGIDPARAARMTPVVGVAAAVALLALNARDLDRSAEKGVTWASTVLETLPEDSLLLTRNPVVVALASDGIRPDVDVIDLDRPSTLASFRTGRMLLPVGRQLPEGPVDPETVRLLLHAGEGGRPVLMDPSVYFDIARRTELLGNSWIAMPHGLAFRLRPVGSRLAPEERKDATVAWEGVQVAPGTPPSPLRDGLGGSEYFARSLVQSAYLHLEQDRPEDASREFLLALGHPGANANVAALGLARLLYANHAWSEVIRTLDACVRDEQEGAWIARRLEGATYLRLGDRERALAALRRALRLTPSSLPQERDRLQRTIRNVEAGRPLDGPDAPAAESNSGAEAPETP